MKKINGVSVVRVSRPFSGYTSSGWATCDKSGVVRVWDAVGRHFTTCHNLTPAQEKSVRARIAPDQRMM